MNVLESMGKPCSCMQFIKAVFFTASHAGIRISTTSHVKVRIRYYKVRIRYYKYQAIPEKISLVCCRWHCYSCCALVTIQTATNS